MEKSIINSALDMHLHLRDDDMLKLVASLTSKSFAGCTYYAKSSSSNYYSLLSML
jgi:dihydroorotase